MSSAAHRGSRGRPGNVSAPLLVHEASGVRWTEDGHPLLPRSYGDAAGEYRALRERAAIVDRCDRAVLRLYGRDPLRILQGMLSNDVTLASATRALYAALLTARGRMVTELRVFRRAEDFLLEVPAAALPGVSDVFRRSIPPLFARWEDLSEAWHVVGVYGPAAGAALQSVPGTALPPAEEEDAAAPMTGRAAPGLVVTTRVTGGAGYDLILPVPAAEGLWRELLEAGVRPAGHAPLDVLRIEAGVPWWGAELTDTTIPLEAGLLHRAISTGKGCYTGQEVIVRILHRGHVNRELRGVLLGQGAGVRRDTPLLEPGTGLVAGRITSSAWSPRLDQEIALAYVRRGLEAGSGLEVGEPGGPVARLTSLPFAL